MNISFGSDNHAGVHPEVLIALSQANQGQVPAYGDDPWTREACEKIALLFGGGEVFLTLNGTGSNVLALRSVLKPWEAVVAPDCAHIHTDETGAPESAGIKILTLTQEKGKILPDQITKYLGFLGNLHHVQPRILSFSQTTELGTLYTPEEVKILTEEAHKAGLLVHMDGARLANACAELGVSPGVLTREAGVDILSFGATKNGALGAEAVIFFTPGLSTGFEMLRKQHLQLSSKMRFVAAQFLALLKNDLWLENARIANAMAKRLGEGLEIINKKFLPRPRMLNLAYPIQANALFVYLPKVAGDLLQKEFPFYWWDESTALARWMTSFSTTESQVDTFLKRLEELLD